MTNAHVRHPFAMLSALAFVAAGCSNASDPGNAGDSGKKVAAPITQVFEYAPEGAAPKPKQAQDEGLIGKGSFSRVYGQTFVTNVTIANGQTVSYQTSNGTSGVDTVIALFRRHDNSTTFGPPYDERVGLQTLAIDDDGAGYPYSSISYTNTSGRTENAHLMVFAWGNATGQADLTGFGTVNVLAGSIKDSGTAGIAKTSGTVTSGGLSGDPWLFTFDVSPGLGNGVYNDDTVAGSNFESTINGATSLTMWYVAHGWNSGTTTISY